MGATQVDLRAFRDAGEHANAIEVYMSRSPQLVALSMGILTPQQSFLMVDFSASKFEVTAFVNGKPIASQTLRLGTQKLEKLIANHLKRAHGLEASTDEVRQILNSHVSKEATITLQYKSIELAPIKQITDNYLSLAEDSLLSCIESLGPGKVHRIKEQGIYFTGGGSLFLGLCEELANRIDFPAQFSQNPQSDVIEGLKLVSGDPDRFRDYLMA